MLFVAGDEWCGFRSAIVQRRIGTFIAARRDAVETSRDAGDACTSIGLVV